MANVKIILDTRRVKSDGTFNLIYRIIHSKKVYTINSGISIKEIHWNQNDFKVNKSHPNHKLLNAKLYQDYYKVQEILLQLGNDFNIEKFRNLFDGKQIDNSNETFKSFADKLILQMFENKKTGNALVYQTALNKFIEFNGNKIEFKDIDYQLLERFTNHLSMIGLKQNSISNYYRTIRAIYNKAIKQKVINRSFYPFYDLTIKSEKTLKRAILKEDIIRLANSTEIENTSSWKAQKYFLLSFYLIGISFTDLAYLKDENIVDNRLVYKRKKTQKTYNIKLFPITENLIFQLRNGNNNKYLFPILDNDIIEDSLKAKRLIQQWIKTTNKYLKKIANKENINNNITTYVARHSFATIAKKMGYSNELIAESLGHEFGNKITNIYLDSFDKEVIDEMHLRVILGIS